MKKPNATQIVLIIAVAGVWSLLGYKVYNYYFGSEEEIPDALAEAYAPEAMTSSAQAPAEYSLHAESYRDPFLGKTARVPRSSYGSRERDQPSSEMQVGSRRQGTSLNSPSGVEQTAPAVVKWPEVAYKGLVENPNHPGSVVGMIRVNGLDNYFDIGYQWRGVRALAIFEDSVRVEYQGERRTITK